MSEEARQEHPGTIIGENIKKLREEKQISQKELAEIIGVTPAAVCVYESGKKEPRANTLRKLARALETDVATLMGEKTVLCEQGELCRMINILLERINEPEKQIVVMKKIIEVLLDAIEGKL